MNLFYIAFRQLFQRNRYAFITFSVYTSILGIALGFFLLIIVDSFTKGFNELIDYKLSQIDGHIRIDFFNKDKKNTAKLDSLLNCDTIDVNDYISNYALIASNQYLDNVIIYSIKSNQLDESFNLSSFLYAGEIDSLEDNDIIVGYKLSQIMDIQIDDKIQLYNIDKIINDNLFNPISFNVKGIIQTGFPEYDKVLTFIKFNVAKKIFNTSSSSSGKIINYKSDFNLNNELNDLKKNMNPFHYNIQSWKERHKLLYDWLNVYSVPIYFVMFFIIILAISNILISLKLIYNKKKINFALLNAIGYAKKDLMKIILYKGMIISISGLLIGLFCALFFLLIQNEYKLISLSSDIYFMNYLPATVDFVFILKIFISTIIFTLFLSFIFSLKINSKSNATVLRNE